MGIWKFFLNILAERMARKYTRIKFMTLVLGIKLKGIRKKITETENEIEEATPKPTRKLTEEEIERLEKLNLKKNSLSLEAAQIAHLRDEAKERLNKIRHSVFFRRTA